MKKNNFMRITSFALLFALVIFSLYGKDKTQYPLQAGYIGVGLKKMASDPTSMVASPHPFATNAALEMLNRGGNAVDAAIAAMMVSAVLDTGKTSFGGGAEITYYDAKNNKTIVINAEPNSFKNDVMPYNGERDSRTGRSIRVPGAIAGFYLAIQKYGVLPWKNVIEPAIFYAQNGFPLHGEAYATIQSNYATLTLQPTARKIFAPSGFLPQVGDVFKQPELAETLTKIAEHGADYFYKGSFAERMVQAIRDIGGKATIEDFFSYQPLELEPVNGTYKEYHIIGPPIPSKGVTALIEGMNILENVDLKSIGHYANSVDSLQWMIETLQVLFEDVARYSGVLELDRDLANLLISKEYARSRYKLIRHKIEQKRLLAGDKSKVADQVFFVDRQSEVESNEGTNNVVAIDKNGNVCSIINTIYGCVFSCSGLYVDGLVLNSAGGFKSEPGERILSEMPATIVFKGEKPYFGVGSSSGYHNPFFLITNILIWDKDLKQAQEAPRLRIRGPNGPIGIEHNIEESVADELRKRGYRFDWVGPYSMRNAQIAGIDPSTGIRYGASDPRGEGKAAGQNSNKN